MRGAVAIALIAAALVACGKERQKRSSDAAPVEVVQKPVFADAGPGGSTDELEPNDADDVATLLALNATVRGKIDSEADADHYRIDVTDPGVLTIEVTGVEGMDLVLELEDAAGTAIAKSDRGAAKIREGIPNAGVTPGRYIAVVKKKAAPPPKKKRKGRKVKEPPPEATPAPPAPPYEITARMAAPVAAAEREPDDDRGTAIDLIVGDTVTGYLGWTGDVDVWKLSVETLSEKNSIDVEVTAIEGTALTVEISDGVGQVLVTRKGPKGAALAVRGLVPVVPAGAPPYHYLSVRGDKSNPETAYQLRVVAKVPGPDAEVEPNDTPEKAMAVPESRTVVHAVWSPGDIDCFVIAPDAAVRTVEVTIDTPAEADLSAELLVDGKVIAKSEQKGKGASERVSGPVPAGAQPVVRVRGTDASAEGTYDVQISEGPAPAP